MLSDPDGLQPIECWEGTAVCRGGRIIRVKNDDVQPSKALTEVKVTKNNKTYRVIYDDRGVPHTVGSPQKIQSERVAVEFMNEDLRSSLNLYDPETGNGSEYLWQDDKGVIPEKKGPGSRREREPPGGRRHSRLHQGHLEERQDRGRGDLGRE
ncbi:hypothetical protein [Streptomyces sp. NPDC005859]|uniref:hypothetical protein n=1 Tax=Streptomyces sp. NPDC005859 TaxID=3157170 RepID=UPI003410090B